MADTCGIPAPEIHYKVSENSRRLLDFHIQKASQSLLEAGAYTVEVDRLMRYSGWHLLGTARMGDDPETSVLDRYCRSHEVENLFVVDGGPFPTGTGANPTLTIMANAYRSSEYIVKSYKGGGLRG